MRSLLFLTHWVQATHKCVSKLTIIGPDNGLSPGRRPSHYLNQWWNIVTSNLRNKFPWNRKRNSFIFVQENPFENVVWEMASILSRPQCVNYSFISGTSLRVWTISWWRHPLETFPALLASCAGNSPVTGEFPTQRPVTQSFDVFFDQRLNKRLSKQLWGWWFETPSRPLWRHCNDSSVYRPSSRINPKTWMFPVSCCSCLCPINWSQVLRREWKCSCSSADRQCPKYIWVINNLIAY